MNKKMLITLFALLLLTAICIMVILTYSVKETFGYISPNSLDTLFVRVNSNGLIEYWVGYENPNNKYLDIRNLVPKEKTSDDIHKKLYKTDVEFIHADTKMSFLEKCKINILINRIIKSDDSVFEYTDGMIINFVIDDDEYNSMQIIDGNETITTKDIYINNLMIALWGLRPSGIDNYFTLINQYPKYMFQINRTNYEDYFL